MHDLPGGSGLRPGSRLGPYLIGERLGRGGMGMVFRAQRDDGQAAAIKVLLNGEGGSRRFQREADALRALEHKGIVRYLAAAEGPPAWLAMELVDGEDFAATMRRGLTPGAAALAVRQAAAAIAHAHARKIIHRDLKPANLLLRKRDGKVLVTDFGLTRSIDGSRFTKTGTMVGTLVYMSPEQVHGQRRIGPASDVWALGVILYECLARQLPFQESEAMATAAAIADRSYTPLNKLDGSIPKDLIATCHACLAKDPGRRPTAEELARALRTRRGIGASTVRLWLGGLGVLAAVLALVVGALLVTKSQEESPTPVTPNATTPDPAEVKPRDPTRGGPPTPWAAAEDPWTRTWALGEAGGREPTLPQPTLWAEPGRVAAPLAAAKRGMPEAFLGAPVALADGEVEVLYDLKRALRAVVRNPSAYFVLGEGDANRVVGDGTTAQILSPNDGSSTDAQLGGARWANPRVRLRYRRIEKIDIEGFNVRCGAVSNSAVLGIEGRAKMVLVRSSKGDKVRVRRGLTNEWTELSFEPGGDGDRVAFDGVGNTKLSAAVDTRPAPGPVWFSFSEVHVALEGVSVAGEIRRPDVPALAIAPGSLPTSARVCAAVRLDGEGLGGPVLALVDTGGTAAVRLELDEGRLLLSRRGRVVAAVDVAGTVNEGWLRLERERDTIRGAWVASGSPVELTSTDPLPLPSGLRAAYGSTAPRLAISAVEVFSAPGDPERAALDAAFAAGGIEGALGFEPETVAGRWRRGALLLARASVPAFADPRFRGMQGVAERRQRAALSARLLAEVADESNEHRSDALARAVLGQVVAASADGADAAARDLVGLLGVERACAAFDSLELKAGEPALLDRLRKGYASVVDPDSREAGLKAALVLIPEGRGEILVELAGVIRLRRNPAPTREDLERALALLAKARKIGGPAKRIDAWEGETLMDLKRYGEALVRFQRGTLLNPNGYWSWLRCSQCLNALGRPKAALEYAIAALAIERDNGLTRRAVYELAQGLSGDGAVDGLTAAALIALSRVMDEPRLVPSDAAIRAARDPRSSDLVAYVRAQQGAFDPPTGDRPTAILARARSGDAAARDALPSAAARDPLVRHLGLLDPDLEELLR